MEKEQNSLISTNQIENFFLNQSVEINYSSFIVSVILSLFLAYCVKYSYLRVGKALNDKEYFSDTFIPLAIVTTLVITVVKFSLALSLGLVGALSIVRFRAAIKEPEELVYLFLIIAIGLANGANQYLLSIISTALIIGFLFARRFFHDNYAKQKLNNLDSNILNIEINDLEKNDINEITRKLEHQLTYLKLKSAIIENKKGSYIFWFDLQQNKSFEFLNELKIISDNNVRLSIYSKTGAYE
jgi:hypothetical protein